HATLVAADPADGARLHAAPAAVTLTFSEPVGADLGGLRVVDGEGRRVDDGVVRTDGPTVTVGLQAGLGEGTYVVGYRVLSADGHPVRGGLTFAVGDADLASGDAVAGVTGEGQDRAWEVAGAVARGVAYVGALLAAGIAVFVALC